MEIYPNLIRKLIVITAKCQNIFLKKKGNKKDLILILDTVSKTPADVNKRNKKIGSQIYICLHKSQPTSNMDKSKKIKELEKKSERKLERMSIKTNKINKKMIQPDIKDKEILILSLKMEYEKQK